MSSGITPNADRGMDASLDASAVVAPPRNKAANPIAESPLPTNLIERIRTSRTERVAGDAARVPSALKAVQEPGTDVDGDEGRADHENSDC